MKTIINKNWKKVLLIILFLGLFISIVLFQLSFKRSGTDYIKNFYDSEISSGVEESNKIFRITSEPIFCKTILEYGQDPDTEFDLAERISKLKLFEEELLTQVENSDVFRISDMAFTFVNNPSSFYQIVNKKDRSKGITQDVFYNTKLIKEKYFLNYYCVENDAGDLPASIAQNQDVIGIYKNTHQPKLNIDFTRYDEFTITTDENTDKVGVQRWYVDEIDSENIFLIEFNETLSVEEVKKFIGSKMKVKEIESTITIHKLTENSTEEITKAL